jgi:hypothetical protein
MEGSSHDGFLSRGTVRGAGVGEGKRDVGYDFFKIISPHHIFVG